LTCIIGLKQGDKTYIGGDSLVTWGYIVAEETCSKVFRVGNFLIGGSGDARYLQAIRYGLSVREQHSDETDAAYMITVFTVALRDCLRTHALLKTDSGVESGNGSFVVAYHGELYIVSHDFACCQYNLPFIAVGSGQEVALGAMAALAADSDPVHRITAAPPVSM